MIGFPAKIAGFTVILSRRAFSSTREGVPLEAADFADREAVVVRKDDVWREESLRVLGGPDMCAPFVAIVESYFS